MRSQLEKNLETLMDEIEKISARPIDNALADRLCAYHGAYKALCMLHGESYLEASTTAYSETSELRTPEFDGDTEFEKVIVSMPFDMEHIKAVMNVFADHMESLEIVNHRAYDGIMAKLREAAKKKHEV